MSTPAAFCVRGSLVAAEEYGEVKILPDRTVVVGANGRIAAVFAGDASDAERGALLREHGIELDSLDCKRMGEGWFVVPGFVDLHVHAPQYSYTGTATDCPLMEWLDRYTFPRESAHDVPDNLAAAAAEAAALIRRLVSTGTTTALYFGTLRLQSTLRFARQLHQAGQRAFVGKVCMDRCSPDSYTASLEQNVADSEAFIREVRGMGSSLLQPVVTPRFVPSCTPALLAALGRLAAEQRTAVQSHISESLDEVAFCQALHPEAGGRDTPVFDSAGLLTDRCVMAHGVCLTDEELRLLAARGTAIAHCPLSNFYFASVLLRVQRCRALGVKVGLGSDVAGGYSPSMLDAIRQAVIASKALRMQEIARAGGAASAATDAHLLDWRQAFWLATRGGAEALDIQDQVGSLEVGKDFDCLIVNAGRWQPPGISSGGSGPAPALPFDVFKTDTPADVFEKFVNLGDDRNIAEVYVRGRQIKR